MKDALEAYRALLKQLDKHGTPTFTVLDFNHHYNSAIDEYLSVNYGEFDVIQKSVDDIRAVVNLGKSLSFTNNTAPLPDEYRHILHLEVVLKFLEDVDSYKKDTEITVRKVQRLRTNRKGFVFENAFQEPSHQRVYFQIGKDDLHIYAGDKVEATTGKIDYIEIPETIYLNPDKSVDFSDPENNTLLQFPKHVNFEIVKVCKRIFLENIESPRYQSSLQEQALRRE